MRQFTVTGMSCAACSARVEKAVNAVDGVNSCSVSLLTNSMGVEGDAKVADIIDAVTSAGYGASLKAADSEDKGIKSNDYDDILVDKETPVMVRRLIASICFLIPLMYLSMGHMMWNWPLPEWLNGNHIAMGLLQLLLTTAIMVINQKFFVNGFKGLIHRAPNMDTLIALGSTASYVYSVYSLFAMTEAQVMLDSDRVMKYMHDLYFESAGTILTLITVGKMLEARSKGKTTDALKGLMKLAPKTATVLRDGIESEVAIEHVKIGDVFIVKPGENIPVDGVVVDGSSAVNEAALTGESIPVDKETGDFVSAATINQSGFLKCEATRVGEDTTLSQIIQMVSDAAATKAPIAKIADKVSLVFVPVVISIAIVTMLGWLIAGETVGFALARGVSVLVISCPCALGLATPVAIMVGNGMGAKHGIMFKTAASLEETGRTQIICLDKTGTVTKGEPVVTDIIPEKEFTDESLLQLAYNLEIKSEHPLAKAIVAVGTDKGLKAQEITEFKAVAGNGLTAKCDGIHVCAGNLKFTEKQCAVNEFAKKKSEELSMAGKTPLFFTHNGKLAGIIAVADVLKADSRQAIQELKNMGITVVMLTGDNARTAKAIGEQATVDKVISEVLPEGKESVVRRLKELGKVAMVGDGINDAPALTRADIGIAIGAGTDIAIDAADVVLMKSSLLDVPAAIRMSRKTLKNIYENLFWAFIYNIIGIPLAAGLFYNAFGWKLNPMFGAAAMSLSSFCVVSNALRLNLFSMYDASKDKRINKIKESEIWDDFNERTVNKEIKREEEHVKMEKTIIINGMMCGHCSGRVKSALEALEGVDEAVVSHEDGNALVKMSVEITDEVLKNTVTEQGYEVVSIQ